ncbi:MAG TPA: AAA family ATPase [Saliniramus sp.]|nr:AAA family ATPase [Saliniramus sp.]
MVVQDQGEAIAFLAGTAAGFGEPVERITTHGSEIFLAGDRAFKLKRAVLFPYLDFSTPEKRLASCGNEVTLNRRTAPEHYLAVRRLTRSRDGRLELDGEGDLVDAVVEMRRFPSDALFDAMARRGELTHGLMDRLAGSIATFHERAEPDTTRGGAENIAGVIAINDAGLRESGLVDASEADRFAQRFRDALERHRELLDARARAGKVRRCHGDLILRNIFLHEGEPTLFDCIDFNADLATIDVLYDLAFLLMDLAHRDLPDHANRVFNRYLDETGEDDGVGLVSFFMAIRAAVRAHVGGAQAAGLPPEKAEPVLAEARAYQAMAEELLQVRAPVLVAIGGLSGTGKSTVAAHLAGHVGSAPGARILNSDRLRKAAFGVAPAESLPPEAYRREVSDRVYERMREEARVMLRAGAPVIADAVFDREDERRAIEALAAETDVGFLGIWLDAPLSVLSARVEARTESRRRASAGGASEENPSDADIAVLRAQIARDPGEISWMRIDADREPDTIRGIVLPLIDAKMRANRET